MPRIGGNVFEGVRFPVSFGDRFLSVAEDDLSGALLVDVYRWDTERDRLVVELLQGRALPGAPPVTVTPVGRSGGVRLSVEPGGDLFGYVSGGTDPTALVISRQRMDLMHGDTTVFTMSGSSIIGSPIGMVVSQSGISLGASLPGELPERRLFVNTSVALTDLTTRTEPLIRSTDFEDCRLIGPAIIASVGPLRLDHCTLPAGHFVWELPRTSASRCDLASVQRSTLDQGAGRKSQWSVIRAAFRGPVPKGEASNEWTTADLRRLHRPGS